ncbi:MAG: hypothetical protein PVI33_01455 [Candidatus Omnitrophota bacterium]|jgi:hypothetical protein
MLKKIRLSNKKAQVTIEYAMVIICLIAALLSMQHYIRRATQGRLREAADTIGEQYDARNVNSRLTTTQTGQTITVTNQSEDISAEAESGRVFGIRTSTVTAGERVRRFGFEQLDDFPAGLYD